MNTFLLLTIIGILFFSIGIITLIVLFDIPPSLSESYYNLLNLNKDFGILFYIYLILTVFILIIPMVEATGFWGFLCGAGLLFVGAAPAFKKNNQKYIHFCGAILCAISAIMELIMIHKWLWIILILAIAVILSLFTKTCKSSTVFWLEMIAFYSLFLGLILFYI